MPVPGEAVLRLGIGQEAVPDDLVHEPSRTEECEEVAARHVERSPRGQSGERRGAREREAETDTTVMVHPAIANLVTADPCRS